MNNNQTALAKNFDPATWLWFWLADYCKREGVNPHHTGLFAACDDMRKAQAAAPAEPSEPGRVNVVASTAEERDAATRMWHKHCDPFKSWMGEAPASPVIDAMLAFAQASGIPSQSAALKQAAWAAIAALERTHHATESDRLAAAEALRAALAAEVEPRPGPGAEGLEPAPPNSLPDWGECALRVANSDFIAKRVAEGGYGPDPDSKLATQLHRFIYEYDDTDPYRSAWFRHRLELLLKEVKALAAPTGPAEQAFSFEMDFYPAWIDENPARFAESVREFLKSHPGDKWVCRISKFGCRIRLTAARKTEDTAPQEPRNANTPKEYA